MLSAVENFNSAAAAATHAYAHHNPFAIAAAAAAAGTAAAAAASVKPLQQATALEHHHHHHHMLSHSSLGVNAGILLPPAQLTALPSPEGTATRTLSSSQLSIHNKLNSNNNSLVAPGAIAMSSAEFVRPHPRQPRYNSSSSSSSNNNNNNSSNNTNNNNTSSNINNVSNNNNNNGSSNSIPLHLRNNKIGNSCVNSAQSPRKKYSTEQLGPVNLVTSNNNNLNNNGGSNSSINSTSSPPIKSPSLEPIQQSPNEIMAEVYAYHQYNRILAANRSLYSDPSSLYSGHHQITRNHSLPTYLSDQFSGYLHHPPPSRAYSPPDPPSSLLRPPPPPPLPTQQQHQQINLGSSHTASSLLNNSHNNSTIINNNNVNTSLCTTQLPVMPDRHTHLSVSLHHNNNNNTSHLPQQPSLGGHDRHQFLSSHAKEKDPKNVDFIISKAPANSAGFKVPSGREGSLKHRFLPRQYVEKEGGRRRSPIAATVLRNSSNSSAPTNFTKGSLIELTTGELRRVEDMRTEDFVQSADRSQHLELADSTVVKICNAPHNVMITFSYNKNRSKVDIDASIEHPFFVYGQGWASCNPELTLKAYGLKCRLLQVGDVCISLKPRESSSYATAPRSPTTYAQPAQQYKEDMTPQNLSRKSSISQASTVPTTATGTAVSSRLSVPMPSHLPPPTSIMSHLPVQPYEMLQSYGTSPPAPPPHQHHLSPHQQNPQHHHPHHQHHLQRQQKADGRFIVTRNNGDHQASPSPPSNQTSRPPSNQPYYLGTSAIDKSGTSGGSVSLNSAELNHANNSDHEAAIDASTSRKRRWSWSDTVNICDEDGQPSPHKTICNSNS